MSHHFDSPTAIADGRLNACDLFAFPTAPGRSALVLTVNPDAGRSSSTQLRPDALYEFVIATDGGTTEDLAFRLRFDEPDGDGQQRVQVARATGAASRSGAGGAQLGSGSTGCSIELAGGGQAWVGTTIDPFFANGAALAQFLQAAQTGQYTPEVFTEPSNLFAGRNVTALVLDLPDSQLGRGPLAVWARISLYGHAPQQQVSPIGQPMLRPLFFRVPGPTTEALNAGNPTEDRAEYSAAVTATAATIARLAGIPDPVGHAARVADAFLPDVLSYEPGQPAHFRPGGPHDTSRDDSPGRVANGRALTDDAFGTTLHLLTGNAIAASTSPASLLPGLPYLGAPDDSDLPALADLLRGGRG